MIPLLVLVGAEHGAHAEEAGVAEDLGDGGVAVAVPAAARVVGGPRTQLLAQHHLDDVLVPLHLGAAGYLLVHLVRNLTRPRLGHILVVGFVYKCWSCLATGNIFGIMDFPTYP